MDHLKSSFKDVAVWMARYLEDRPRPGGRNDFRSGVARLRPIGDVATPDEWPSLYPGRTGSALLLLRFLR